MQGQKKQPRYRHDGEKQLRCGNKYNKNSITASYQFKIEIQYEI